MLGRMVSSAWPEGSVERWQRDWEWLANCPPLVLGPCLPKEILTEWNRPLESLEVLEKFFDPDSSPRARNRVGFYTETLVEAALASVPAISEIQHSLPIREGNRTLGELDFLFRYRDELFHLEIALKFYLYSASETKFDSHYIGPNAGDTLERKSSKLLGHQLPLGKQAYPEIASSFLFCPGILFYHPDEEPPERPLEVLSSVHRRGWWLRAGEFRAWLEQKPELTRGEILRKPFWLASSPHFSSEELLDEVEHHFSGSDQPVQLALAGEAEEVEPIRVFVVDEKWPHRAAN